MRMKAWKTYLTTRTTWNWQTQLTRKSLRPKRKKRSKRKKRRKKRKGKGKRRRRRNVFKRRRSEKPDESVGKLTTKSTWPNGSRLGRVAPDPGIGSRNPENLTEERFVGLSEMSESKTNVYWIIDLIQLCFSGILVAIEAGAIMTVAPDQLTGTSDIRITGLTGSWLGTCSANSWKASQSSKSKPKKNSTTKWWILIFGEEADRVRFMADIAKSNLESITKSISAKNSSTQFESKNGKNERWRESANGGRNAFGACAMIGEETLMATTDTDLLLLITETNGGILATTDVTTGDDDNKYDLYSEGIINWEFSRQDEFCFIH